MNETEPVMMRADALMSLRNTQKSEDPPVLTEKLPTQHWEEDYMHFLQNRLMTEMLAEIEVLLPILISRITAEWKANHHS